MKKDQDRSLKTYIFRSWLIPGALAFLVSVAVFILIEFHEYQGNIGRTVDKLTHQSSIVSRRLSAEVMLGENGASEAVAAQLTKDLKLRSIVLTTEKPDCFNDKEETCYLHEENHIHFYQKIPSVEDQIFSEITIDTISFYKTLNLALLLWSGLPIFLTLAVGIYIQRIYLRRYVLRPIQALVETTAQGSTPPKHWPLEIKDLSKRLGQSFEKQEQAIFGQLARGVVHDVKTLLHSVMAATDLAQEVPEDSEKRKTRLESLLRASSLNLPKMKKIIELTLDGSREIPVHLKPENLNATIQSSISSTQALADSRKVKIVFDSEAQELLTAHDSIQLERAFTNLIKNGIESFDSKKSATENIVLIQTKSDKNKIYVSVEDYGPGLPFSPEQAFKPLRSTKAHGSGLGLFVSRKIIESHRGYLAAGSSEKLSGAKFTITLESSGGSI